MLGGCRVGLPVPVLVQGDEADVIELFKPGVSGLGDGADSEDTHDEAVASDLVAWVLGCEQS
eukprot:833734-Rhodomonas_salina.4